MSGYTPFLIAAPKGIGIERDLEPFMIPEQAYPDLQDCYCWRGRVKKRDGFIFLARLRRKIGTTNGAGDLTVTLSNVPLGVGFSFFQVGSTTYQDPGGASPVALLVNGVGTASLNRSTGLLTITGAPLTTDVFYFPGLPVMGLRSLDATLAGQEVINVTDLIGFDTRFAYILSSGNVFNDLSFYRGTTTEVSWSGTDSDLFWTTNYANAMWATNFVMGFQGNSVATTPASGDGIRWLDQDESGWVNFLPQITAVPTYLMGCLIIVPYKGRLVTLNTYEGTNFAGGKNFPQRARWCQFGTPFYTTDQSGVAAPKPTFYQGGQDQNAWRSDIPGKGGFIDAPTQQQIVSAEFVKDTLIVYFERSTWQLVYTGDTAFGIFQWVQINTELGSGSTFSIVPFDDITIAIGNSGIHGCDSISVQRIDQKIPDEVFSIQNKNKGIERVFGIRDYYNQLVYWSMPYIGDLPPPLQGLTFPNKILVYNYIDQTFSFFSDSFTCFGYFQSAQDLTWQQASMTWGEANFNWIAGQNQSEFQSVIGGNQQGFVEILMQTTTNGDSLQIANITPGSPDTNIFSPNHNIIISSDPVNPVTAFVKVTSAGGITGLTGNIYEVVSVIDANNFHIRTLTTPTGVFTGPGTIAIVNNVSILTKRFNPYLGEDSQVRLGYVDFYFDKTTFGQVTVNLFIDDDTSIPVNLTNNTINTFPETTYQVSPDTTLANTKLWKRMYFQDISQFFQLEVTLNPDEMTDNAISSSDVVLHAMVLWFSKSGRMINV